MSYTFLPGRTYRMPTHFGPAPGPRQAPGGASYDNREAPHTWWAWLSYRTDGQRLDRHLPAGFSRTSDAEVLVEVRQRRNLPWLAGRGYNIVVVSFANVTYDGGSEPVRGNLQAVVWESLPDAVLTGREELGIPKLWANVGPLQTDLVGGTASCTAAWDGFAFLQVKLQKLRAQDVDDLCVTLPASDYLQLRYFPRPGTRGEADVCYPTVSPAAPAHRRVRRAWTATGSVELARPRWEDLPTMHHVVQALADLPVLSVPTGGLFEVLGNRDLADQRPLERYPG